MTSTTIPLSMPFNILGCFERLKDAGIPEKHAMAQAEVLQSIIQAYDEKNRTELATKGDVRESELRLQKEIEVVRKEIEIVRKDIVQSKHEMVKWIIGLAVAQMGMMFALYAIK